MFAPALEDRWGSKRFLIYYLITGLGAAVVQEAVWVSFVRFKEAYDFDMWDEVFKNEEAGSRIK